MNSLGVRREELGVLANAKLGIRNEELEVGWGHKLGQYRIILSADTASEVRQMLSQKRR